MHKLVWPVDADIEHEIGRALEWCMVCKRLPPLYMSIFNGFVASI